MLRLAALCVTLVVCAAQQFALLPARSMMPPPDMVLPPAPVGVGPFMQSGEPFVQPGGPFNGPPPPPIGFFGQPYTTRTDAVACAARCGFHFGQRCGDQCVANPWLYRCVTCVAQRHWDDCYVCIGAMQLHGVLRTNNRHITGPITGELI